MGMSELLKKLKIFRDLLEQKRSMLDKKIIGPELAILNFVRSNGVAKSQRDVIRHFSAMHERTARRYLDKLIKSKLVKKEKRGREVVYSARLQQD